MTRVRKSPNMMSTTGRSPVMAAPTPRPAIPASEIGESRIRSGPNSSTSPDSTLNGVPASATSSPITNTLSSRRSSSARASLTAWARVISRVDAGAATLDEDILGHLTRIGEWRRERKLDAALDLAPRLDVDRPQGVRVRQAVLAEPARMQDDRVALVPPKLLLFLRAVVLAVDVADVMAVIAVGVAEQERGAGAAPRPCDQLDRLLEARTD